MRLLETTVCSQLDPVSIQMRERIETANRTEQDHRNLMCNLPALYQIESNGPFEADPLPGQLSISAWNLERCLDPRGSAELLALQAPDIVLLSEMDCGMARTGQNHTIRDLAGQLGMGYAYVVEFYELGLGSELEVELASYSHNERGWHGNGLLCRSKPVELALIRLDDHGHWYCGTAEGADPGQPRIGGRVAVAAKFATERGPVCVVSTHLESAGSISIRQSQMDRIIAAVDAFAPDMPVVIGGDLNTGNNLSDADWRAESLFEATERQAYSWSANTSNTTTRASRLTRFPERAMKLDWFAHRGLEVLSAETVPALDARGIPLSDHELIKAEFGMPV